MFEKQTSSTNKETVSELDEKLMADKNGSFKKELLEKIQTYRNDLKSKMNAGNLSPEEFEVAQSVAEAFKNAEDIVKDR